MLVLSLCASVLAWLEPRGAARGTPVTAQVADELARHAVRVRPADGAGRWRRIEITAVERSGGGAFLAAFQSASCDFVVSSYGRVRCTTKWADSIPSSSDGVIAVGLAGFDDESDIPLAQWVGLRALLLRLRDSLPDDGDPLPITLGPLLGERSPQLGDVLRTLTASLRLSNNVS